MSFGVSTRNALGLGASSSLALTTRRAGATTPALAEFNFQTGTYLESGTPYALASAPGWVFSRSGARYTNTPSDGLFATNTPRVVSGSGALFSVGVTNQARASTDFSQANWELGAAGSISGTPVASPSGAVDAQVLTWPSGAAVVGTLDQHNAGDASVALTWSVWFRVASGTKNLRFYISNWTVATTYSSDIAVTSTWTRFSFPIAAAALSNTGTLGFGLWTASGGAANPIAAGDLLQMWGPQVETGASATAYAPNASTTLVATVADDSAVLTRAGAASATVTYGGVSVAGSPASPLDLGVTGGGAWLGSFVQTVLVR